MTGSPSSSPDGIEAVLRFYQEAGVEDAVADAPVDRFAHSARLIEDAVRQREAARRARLADAGIDQRNVAPDGEPVPLAPLPAGLTEPSPAAAEAARRVAASAATLEALREKIAAFDGCNLRVTATNLVFGAGDPQARLMLVADAPELDDDLEGTPFAGQHGALLDRMLAAIGQSREGVYLAHIVPWRPPAGRPASDPEMTICRPFLDRQIALVQPEVLVIFGDAATRELLGRSEGATALRGAWQACRAGGRETRAMPMFHPRLLLRQPSHKRLAWHDLRMVRAALDGQDQGPTDSTDE